MLRIQYIYRKLFKTLSVISLIGLFAFMSDRSYAEPLSLSELNRFNKWIQDTESCREDTPYERLDQPTYIEQRARFRCLSRAGVPSHQWEKDGARSDLSPRDSVYPIDRHDLKLAILEFQSQRLANDNVNQEYDGRDGFGADFDPSQLICYGDLLVQGVERDDSDTEAVSGDVVIPGTLCPYDSAIDAEDAFYGCPYLSGVNDAAVANRHYPFCSAYSCGLPAFNFDREVTPTSATESNFGESYWAQTYRPLLCPEVVCDLYQREPAPENQEELCYPDERSLELPQWLSSRLAGETLCDLSFSGGSACNLNQRCVYQDDLGRGVCVDRAECAQRDGCPVAELQLMSESDQELIMWVYLLHSSAPVRTLDLHFTYPRDQLVLADSRRLPALQYSGGAGGTDSGKQLATQHYSDGTLRLSVFDPVSSAPIPYGPIIELVFRRVGSEEVTVSFTDDAELRETSMAPNQSSARAQLREDGAWGDPVQIEPRDNAEVKLRLWYDFENLNAPLAYNTTQTAEALCEEITDCALEPEEARRELYLNRLRRLQRGQAYLEKQLDGISQMGGYLDGVTDHIRLPIMVHEELRREAQSFSFSTWFYTEGNSEAEELDTPQVIFAHNNLAERTRFGLWVRENEDAGRHELQFFNGDYLALDLPTGLEITELAEIERRKWYHLAFTFDARTRHLKFYLDGEELTHDQMFGADEPHPFSCPQFNRGRDIVLHTEGEILGGQSPDTIYYATKRSGLYKIWRRNTEGTSDVEILSSGVANYLEPDYQPELDRLIFVSNASGSEEIWISNGAGENRRQLTVGFGNAELGVSARAPRWSPDGSGIVFESNAFDVIAADNIADQVYHLYYIPYNARENTTAIRLPNGSTVEQLNYQDRLLDETIVFFRLTYGDDTRQHRKVRWLEGKDEENERRGRILFESSTPLYRERGISEMLIDEVIPLSASSVNSLSTLRSGEIDEEISLLDAHRSVRVSATGNQEIERLLYKRSFTRYEQLNPISGASFTVTDQGRGHLMSARVIPVTTPIAGAGESPSYTHLVAIEYEPDLDAFSETCWDTNRNGAFDPIEDRNQDNFWNREDCALREISQLYLEYDISQVEYKAALSLKSASSAQYLAGGQVIERAPWNKRVSTSEVNAPGKAMVGVQLISALEDQPLTPSGAQTKVTLALLAFKPKVGTIPEASWASVAGLQLVQRFADETLVVRDLNPDPEYCWDLNLDRRPDPIEDRNGDQEFNIEDCGDQIYEPRGRFEVVRQASFSPQGDTLLFNAISQARPVLLYSPDLLSGDRIQSLSERSQDIKGLSWRSDEVFFPCNWVGGYLQPRLKRITASLRGGLDDLKLHEGVRNLNSIRSEAERGREWLEREDRAGTLSSNAPDCGTSHLDCPPYHLCVESRCVITPCEPQASAGELGSCVDLGAQCRLRPISIEQEVSLSVEVGGEGPENYDWICVAECSGDQECYQQNCMNGPCLFCDTNTSACAECRERQVSFGNTTETRVEGCPDQRSFYCADGACRSECYSFEGQQSLYLCDSVTEFCDQGRCVLRDWEWEDLSPLTFLGAADARHDLAPSSWSHYTVAIGESYPLEIQAYGVSDLGSPPELLVQVKGGPLYGTSDWRTLGRVSVTNKSASEAAQYPILLDSVHPYDAVRMSLIKPPYQNAAGLATGLGTFDRDFCMDDVLSSNVTGDAQAKKLCERLAQGSKFRLGYRLDLPTYESIKACQSRGHAGCAPRGRDDNLHLYGGSPGVKVVEVKSSGASISLNKSRNPICSYEGGSAPIRANGTPAKIYYGKITEERSNERAQLCERDPSQCFNRATDGDTISYNGTGGLLNCNLSLADSPSESAAIEYANISWLQPSRSQGIINLDDGDSCVIAVDNLRSAVCYEWVGGGVTLDPYTSPVRNLSNLKMSVSRSFGHDRGFEPQPPPAWRASVTIEGYAGGSGLALSNGFESVLVPVGGGAVSFQPLFQGWSYSMSVVSQPVELGLSCNFVAEPNGLELTGRVTSLLEDQRFKVICRQSHQLQGCVYYESQQCQEGPETGKSVALTASISVGGSSLSAEVNAYLDRPFSFSRRLPIGASYEVSVVANPLGVSCVVSQGAQGQVTGSGTPNIIVSCSDQPEHLIPVRVTGLGADESITLYDRVSETSYALRPAELTSDGVGSFSTPVREGSGFEIIIREVSRRYSCQVTGGVGMMPAQGFPADQYVQIDCDPIPAAPLTVAILGVPPQGSLMLKATVFVGGDQDQAIESDVVIYESPNLGELSNAEADFTVSGVELFNGDQYRIAVVSKVPRSLTCTVRNAEDPGAELFTYRSAQIISPVLISCENPEATPELYSISGLVYGLESGDTVKLSLNNSPSFLNVTSQESEDPTPEPAPFTFDSVINDYTYEITVGIQPEGYSCEVTEGATGRVSDAPVTGVRVDCSPAGTLQVTFNVGRASEGAPLLAKLMSRRSGDTPPRLVGVIDDDAVIEEGRGTFDVIKPGGGPEAASLVAGTYDLYLFKCTSGNRDQANNPKCISGDHGRYQAVQIRAGETTRVSLRESDLGELVAAGVNAVAPEDFDAPEEASMTCLFLPANTLSFSPGVVGRAKRDSVPSPADRAAPVIGRAARICNQEDCGLNSNTYTANELAYIPMGTYQVSCFVDVNDSDSRNNGDLIYDGTYLISVPLTLLGGQ